MCICKIHLIVFVFVNFLLHAAVSDTTTAAVQTATVDPLCVKDKSKPQVGDNVQSCPKTSNDSVCCFVKSSWGCCPPGDSGSGQLPLIGGILGGITASLIIIIFFWKCCNREQMPCLGKVIDKMKKICPCLDRRRKEANLTLPKGSKKDNFTDEDFHGGPAWFFSDDPFATQGGARSVPQPPPEVDVADELHGQNNGQLHNGELHSGFNAHPENENDKHDLADPLDLMHSQHSPDPPITGEPNGKDKAGLEKMH